YGPGETVDSPANMDDLEVPPRERPALEQIVSELRLRGQTAEQAVRTINNFFLTKFTYSTWQRPSRHMNHDETPLSRFLLISRSGHCEYFATAGVLLLRQAGVPARYAVGFAVHEGSGNKYVVRQRDAHAWCLVWQKNKGLWQDYDGTPGSWIDAEARRNSQVQWLLDLWSRITFEFSKV